MSQRQKGGKKGPRDSGRRQRNDEVRSTKHWASLYESLGRISELITKETHGVLRLQVPDVRKIKSK